MKSASASLPRVLLLWSVLWGLLAGGASAQPPFEMGGGAGPAVEVRVERQFERVARGEAFAIAVILEHAEHYHSWPNKPVVPKELEGLYPFATEIEVGELPAGVTVAGAIQWPEAKPVPVKAGRGTVDVLSYTGTAIAYVTFRVAEDAPLGQVQIPLMLSYQACDDTTCLIPEDVDFSPTIEIVEAGTPAGEVKDAAVFAGYVGVPEGGSIATEEPVTEIDTDIETAPRLFLGFIPIGEGSGAGLVLITLLSLVGGFVLNLTPCVLPVIPIKIMTLTQHAGSRQRTIFLGLMMAAGVVAFWVGLSIPVMIYQSFSDPSVLFGIWWVTLGLGALIAVLSLGLMGLFTLNLPQGLYMINPKADSAHGSFLFGVMTAVLGLPCFGFVAGALLGAIASQPRIVTGVVFTGIGVGMAAPYLLLSFNPKLIEKIPRTGPASELVKQVMGLLMLAAGAFFVGSGLMGLVAEKPYVGKVLHWWFVAFFGAAAGLWLAYRTVQITKKPLRRVFFVVAGLAVAAGLIAWANGRTEGAFRDSTLWKSYSPEALAQAKQDGKIVVLDFTADWCVNCKALKATVLDRKSVWTRLADDSVVPFTVDLTSRKAPGNALLRDELGETGIPLLVVYGVDGREVFRSNAYTAAQVLSALDRAAQPAP